MLSARAAMLLYLAVFALALAGGLLVGPGLFGIALVEWLAIGVPVVAVAAAFGGKPPGEVLRVAPVRAQDVAGATLVGASAWIVLVELILPIQERLFPMPEELARQLEAITTTDAPLPLALLSLAITPAICEELLCRGALLFALRPRLGPVWAVTLSAALFAALHLSPYRFLPTFALGLLFGAMALRARSIVPAMLAHAINNSAVVLVDHPVGKPLHDVVDAHPIGATLAAVVVLTIGVGLVMRKQ